MLSILNERLGDWLVCRIDHWNGMTIPSYSFV